MGDRIHLECRNCGSPLDRETSIKTGGYCHSCFGTKMNSVEGETVFPLKNTKPLMTQIGNYEEIMLRTQELSKGENKEKECEVCHEIKPLSEFRVSKSKYHKRSQTCKQCEAQIEEVKQNVPEGYKFCLKCMKVKPMDDFYNKSSTPDGKQVYCKPCMSKYNSLRNKNAKNPEKLEEEKVTQMEPNSQEPKEEEKKTNSSFSELKESYEQRFKALKSLVMTVVCQNIFPNADNFNEETMEASYSEWNQCVSDMTKMEKSTSLKQMGYTMEHKTDPERYIIKIHSGGLSETK